MASSVVRRPLPALVSLVALLLLTGIVWWRVMNRDDSVDNGAAGCPSPTSSASSTAPKATLPAPGSITLSVLNSTNRAGLAGKVRTTLQGVGFTVGEPGNDRTPNKSTAEIRYGPTGAAAAKLVHLYFPDSRLVPGTSTNATVVVSLGSAFTAVASKASVDAQLKKADVAVASSAPTSPGSPAPAPTDTTANC